MRQIGILAAAGIYALDHHIDRLQEDHEHAQQIAKALAAVSWAGIEPQQVETNIIFFKTIDTPAQQVVNLLADKDILCFATGAHTIRMVTHLDISEDDTAYIIKTIQELIIQP